MGIKSMVGAMCTCLAVVSFSADAALISRLGDLAYYDTDADLTWLADANYAQTSGYDTDGLMLWADANAWATNLNVAGVTGWRLADAKGCSSVNCTSEEMGNLFYNVLGGTASQSIVTTHNANYDLFSNIQPWYYWLATKYTENDTGAWYFGMHYGGQGVGNTTLYSFSAWAVHDGDVGRVPVPSAVWLFGSGLIGLIGVARRKKT